MKHSLVVAVLLFAAASDTWAQGVETHNRFGPSGTHISLPSDIHVFNYEATVLGASTPFQVKLEVYLNGVLQFTDLEFVGLPTPQYAYSCPVFVMGWGLKAGDTVTFVCTVIDTATGTTLDTDYLFGDVITP